MSISAILIPIVIASIASSSLLLEKSDENKIVVTTIMKDENILKEAMAKYGYKSEENKNNLKIFTENGEAIFRLNEENLFQAVFKEDFSKNDAETIINHIFEEYTLLVQEKTYEKIMENIDNYNFKVESEEITEKNSIVITLEMQ